MGKDARRGKRVVVQCCSCGIVKRTDGKPCSCGSKAFAKPSGKARFEFCKAEKEKRQKSAERIEAVKRRYAEEAERKERRRLAGIQEEARRNLRQARLASEVEHATLRRRRFDTAWAWVFVHCSNPEQAQVTQVGDNGFFWKRPGQIVASFVVWKEAKTNV